MVNSKGQIHIRIDTDLKQVLAESAEENRRTLSTHAAFLLEEYARQYRNRHPATPKVSSKSGGISRQEQASLEWQETLKLIEELQKGGREGREGR